MSTSRENLVRDMVEKWKHIFGLQAWLINIEISEKKFENDARCEASIEEDLKYLEADLTVYPAFWKNDREHQEINIAHELVHLVLCPLHKYLPPLADDVLEGVVQHLAMSAFTQQQ